MSRHRPGTKAAVKAMARWAENWRQRPPLQLHVASAARTPPRWVAQLRKHLPAAHAMLHAPLRELSLALVGDRRMALLHEQFMGLAGPTDVLTFPLEEDARGRVTSGEVVVCVPEARRRAKEHGVAVERELLLYALHGMLHLCGYDDRTDADFQTMHGKEDQILAQLGVGPVFAPAQTAADKRPRRPQATQRRATPRRRATGAH